MPFVKLDCGILDSTLWFERDAREVFITALLMAQPVELTEPCAQIAVRTTEPTGWIVQPGWYGLVPAAGIGILHRAKVGEDVGYIALEQLGQPEATSRSPEFEGRRLVRIAGGFIVLNYMQYRERDYTAAERSKRYRQNIASRRSVTASRSSVTPERRDITQAEAEAEAEAEAKKILVSNNKPRMKGGGSSTAPPPVSENGQSRSKRPIFTGQRLTVFEWQLDDCLRTLGADADPFDLHAWFFTLDALAVSDGLVLPKRDGGEWLQHQLVAEAQRRGLKLKLATVTKGNGFSTEGMIAEIARQDARVKRVPR